MMKIQFPIHINQLIPPFFFIEHFHHRMTVVVTIQLLIGMRVNHATSKARSFENSMDKKGCRTACIYEKPGACFLLHPFNRSIVILGSPNKKQRQKKGGTKSIMWKKNDPLLIPLLWFYKTIQTRHVTIIPFAIEKIEA